MRMSGMRGGLDLFAFLEMYRDQAVLWNRVHRDYKQRAARDEAEKKMMEAFGFDCRQDLRNKIRSLRSTYNMELAKINASIKNGADEHTVYKPKLIWFPLADSFLGKNLEEGGEEESPWTEQTDNGQEHEAMAEDPGEAEDTEPVRVKREKLLSRRPRFKKIKRKRRILTVQPDTSHITGQQSAEEMVGASEFVVFGQHVAIQLEKLPVSTAVKVQERIQSLLTKARLQSLRSDIFQAEYVDEDGDRDPISDSAGS